MRENQPLKHSILHFLFRYRIVKLIILLVLHLLGAFSLAILVFALVEYVLGIFGFVLGHIMAGL